MLCKLEKLPDEIDNEISYPSATEQSEVVASEAEEGETSENIITLGVRKEFYCQFCR